MRRFSSGTRPGQSRHSSSTGTSCPWWRSASQRDSIWLRRVSTDMGLVGLGGFASLQVRPLAVQRVVQPEARRAPAALDGALGDLQDLGRLGLGEALVVQQVEQFALL